MSKKRKQELSLVVIGGGIGGVSCAQELARLNPEQDVLLISGSDAIFEAKTVFTHTQYLEEISIFERTVEQFTLSNPRIKVLHDEVSGIDSQLIYTKSGEPIHYDKLCLAVGVRPKTIAKQHPLIIGLRDLESIEDMISRLKEAKTVCVIGNGGIALELIHELTFCNVEWIIKDDYIGSKFFDATASAFIMPSINARMEAPTLIYSHYTDTKSCHHEKQSTTTSAKTSGYGLGPDWAGKSSFRSMLTTPSSKVGSLKVHFYQEVVAYSSTQGASWMWLYDENQLISLFNVSEKDFQLAMEHHTDNSYPLLILTSKAHIIGCDFLISATGVAPNTEFLRSTDELKIALDEDGYVIVDDFLQSPLENVYAVGDCCQYRPKTRSSLYYFQMRLWSQARIMGIYAAQCMCGLENEYGTDTHLELFAHITRFFGFKVVLLGRYNAQGFDQTIETAIKRVIVKAPEGSSISEDQSSQDQHNSSNDLEIWIRVTPNKEYVKVVVYRGKVVGALLIGDTDMEETFENLILNQMDVSNYGIGLLDPDIDITDYFD